MNMLFIKCAKNSMPSTYGQLLLISANIGAKWNDITNIEVNKTGRLWSHSIGYSRLYNLVEDLNTNDAGHQIPFHDDNIIFFKFYINSKNLAATSSDAPQGSVLSPLLMIYLPCHFNYCYLDLSIDYITVFVEMANRYMLYSMIHNCLLHWLINLIIIIRQKVQSVSLWSAIIHDQLNFFISFSKFPAHLI